MLVRVAEGRDVALGIELQIIQKQHSLAIELRLSNIFDKVGASNRVELTLFAVHHRLLDRG